MYEFEESARRLNQYALVLDGREISFRVHYWGINTHHLDNPVHKHSFFEICFVWDGTGDYTDNGDNFPLRRNTMFCSRPGIVHQIRSMEGLHLLYVAFEVDEAKSSAALIEGFRRLSAEARVCLADAGSSPSASLWRALLVPAEEERGYDSEQLPGIAHALLRSFLPLFAEPGPKPPYRQPASSMLLQQAKLYIRDNLDRPLTLGELAGYLHVSERHLSRLFSGGIHESFSSFLRRERIRQAAHDLTHTELAIKDIAARSGFSSVHAFTRAFTQEMQQSPARFRRGDPPVAPT